MTDKQLTILIVDDDQFMRDAIQMLIKNLKHTLLTAANGNEALEVLKSQNVDLVISDIQMPNGNGVFLLEEIRRINPDIPVVHLMTGQSSYAEEEMIRKGATGVLLKPFKRKQLLEVIEATISRLTPKN